MKSKVSAVYRATQPLCNFWWAIEIRCIAAAVAVCRTTLVSNNDPGSPNEYAQQNLHVG